MRFVALAGGVRNTNAAFGNGGCKRHCPAQQRALEFRSLRNRRAFLLLTRDPDVADTAEFSAQTGMMPPVLDRDHLGSK